MAELTYLINNLKGEMVENLEHCIPKIRGKIRSKKKGVIRYAVES